MRTTLDRVRHTLLFELIGLGLFIPLSSYVFKLPATHMGVIGIGSATAATLWNFLFNLFFDKAMHRNLGHTRKTWSLRFLHAALFELGLMLILVPPIAWYLGIGLMEAVVMDLAIVAFYMTYAFVFNVVYDRVFPIPEKGPACA